MKESLIIYNVIPSQGKLDKIHDLNNPKKSAACKLSNKCKRKDFAYILNIDDGAQGLLDTFLKLHNYGIPWKRNQLFYNDNCTNFLVLDFDTLSAGAAADLREYASQNKNKCILIESNSYNTQLDKLSFKLYHITAPIQPTCYTFNDAYENLEKAIFGWRYGIESGYTYSTVPDKAFANNLLQVVYNQVRIDLPKGFKKGYSKNWVYKYHESFKHRFIDEEDGLPTELPRKEWEFNDCIKNVSIGKYKDIRSLFPNATLEDCKNIGHVPNVNDRIAPFSKEDFKRAKRKKKKDTTEAVREELYLPKAHFTNYGCIRDLSPDFQKSKVHVNRYLPITMSHLCKEFNLHFSKKIFAPYYRLPIIEPEQRKGRHGRHKRYLIPRIKKCIFNLIVANHVLRNCGIPYQYNLYSILQHINHFINTRFTDLDDFRKDHDNKQLYDLIYKMYRSTRIKEELESYRDSRKKGKQDHTSDDRFSCFYYHSNITKIKRQPYLQVIGNYLHGNWGLFNLPTFQTIINKTPKAFSSISSSSLYQWVMKNKVPKVNSFPKKRGTYNSRHKVIATMNAEEREQYRIEHNISETNMRQLNHRYPIQN